MTSNRPTEAPSRAGSSCVSESAASSPVVLDEGLPVLTQLSFDDTYVYTVELSIPGSLIRVAK